MGASGFHGDTFSQGFGDFDTMKKRRMGMGASGFHGDTFSQGFGDFDTMKKRSDYESDGKEATQELKQENVSEAEPGSRRKRDADEDDNLADSYDDPSTPYEQRYLMHQDEEEDEEDQEDEQEVEGEVRAKRNLEKGGLLQVELRPPVMIPLNTRRKRSQDADHYDTTGTQTAASRPLYKRSTDWETSDDLGGFSTMKRRR